MAEVIYDLGEIDPFDDVVEWRAPEMGWFLESWVMINQPTARWEGPTREEDRWSCRYVFRGKAYSGEMPVVKGRRFFEILLQDEFVEIWLAPDYYYKWTWIGEFKNGVVRSVFDQFISWGGGKQSSRVNTTTYTFHGDLKVEAAQSSDGEPAVIVKANAEGDYIELIGSEIIVLEQR